MNKGTPAKPVAKVTAVIIAGELGRGLQLLDS